MSQKRAASCIWATFQSGPRAFLVREVGLFYAHFMNKQNARGHKISCPQILELLR